MVTSLLILSFLTVASQPDTSFRLSEGTAVSIETMIQDVDISSTPGNMVHITNGTARLRGGILHIESRGQGGGVLGVALPSWARAGVETLSGSVSVANGPAHIHVETVSGDVKANGGSGSIYVSTLDGQIAIGGVSGEGVEIETIAGDIELVGIGGRISVGSVDSDINISNSTGNSVTVSTTSGDITWNGPISESARYNFESHNGDIHLEIPTTTNARLSFTTSLGDIESSIPASFDGNRRSARPIPGQSRNIVATLGEGRASISVATFSGSLTIEKQGSNRKH